MSIFEFVTYFWKFMDGLPINFQFTGIITYLWLSILLSILKLHFVFTISKASLTYFIHPKIMLFQRFFPYHFQPLFLMHWMAFCFVFDFRYRFRTFNFLKYSILEMPSYTHASFRIELLTIAILLASIKHSFVNIVFFGQSSFTLIQAVLQVANIFFGWLLNIELSSFMTLFKLPFHFNILIEVYFYSQPMLKPIKKLAEIDFCIVEIKESLICHIFFYGKTKVYTIFILLYMGRFDNDATFKY